MKPSKKRPPAEGAKVEPEAFPEVGGTNGDEEHGREQGLEGDEGSGGGYGRPREDDHDERS